MKQVTTWLDDSLFTRYQKHVKKLNTNPYRHIKHLILTDLGDEKAHMVQMSIIYGFTLWSLFASVIVLVF